MRALTYCSGTRRQCLRTQTSWLIFFARISLLPVFTHISQDFLVRGLEINVVKTKWQGEPRAQTSDASPSGSQEGMYDSIPSRQKWRLPYTLEGIGSGGQDFYRI